MINNGREWQLSDRASNASALSQHSMPETKQSPDLTVSLRGSEVQVRLSSLQVNSLSRGGLVNELDCATTRDKGLVDRGIAPHCGLVEQGGWYRRSS